MTYGFKMANNVTDLRVTGNDDDYDHHHWDVFDTIDDVKLLMWRAFRSPSSMVFLFLLFLGMLKDVEEELQRKVKVRL